jgi:transposase
MQHYVGLDVHSKQTTFVIGDETGRVVAQGEVPTTPQGLRRLKESHQLAPGTPVALETGTTAFFVARQLADLSLAPQVIDAHEVRVKAHRPRQKSDRRDAHELCEGLRRGIYRTIVHVPSAAVGRLRETLSRRRHFVRMQTAEINAAKRLLRGSGLAQRSRHLGSEVGWAKLMAALEGYGEVRSYLEHHHKLWRCAGEELAVLEASLAEQCGEFSAALERLGTIPGVGSIVAATLVAFFADVGRFPSAKHAASYAGLIPATYHSGDRESYGRITKRGSGELRAMLCEAAHHAGRPQHPLNPYFAKLCAKRGYKMATIAVAHRLARIAFAMLRDGTDFEVGKLNVEEGPFVRSTVRRYRLRTPAAVRG